MSNENQVDWIVESVHPVTGGLHTSHRVPENVALDMRNQLRAGGYKTLRLAKASRLKDGKLPKYRVPKANATVLRPIESVVERYLQWAAAKKLPVIHMFKTTGDKKSAADRAYKVLLRQPSGSLAATVYFVDAEDFFGPSVGEEVIDG